MTAAVNVDRVQSRFEENPDRFEIVKPKRSYNQKSQAMQPPSGPSSSSPGPWLPETIVNAWMLANKDPKKLALLPRLPEYKNAVTIRDSFHKYKFGPVQPPPIDDSPRFSMVDQPNVLAGKRWLESDIKVRSLRKLTQHAEELESSDDTEYEGSLYQLNDEGEVEDTDDHEECVEVDPLNEDSETESEEARETKSSAVRVSDEKMDAVYRNWFSAEPSHSMRQTLWETLHHFYSRKSSLAHSGDDLRKQGLSDDFQMEFMLRLMPILDRMKERGTIIHEPSHYLTRTWTNCRIAALKKLTKENRKHPSILELRNSEGDLDEDAPNLIDFAESQRWKNGNNAEENTIDDQETADEELLKLRSVKLAMLDPDLADVVGMRLAGQKQKDIAKKLNISQQAVSKLLQKAKSCLQEVN